MDCFIFWSINRHCLHEAHAPCSCELWSNWLKKIAEMIPKIPMTKGEHCHLVCVNITQISPYTVCSSRHRNNVGMSQKDAWIMRALLKILISNTNDL